MGYLDQDGSGEISRSDLDLQLRKFRKLFAPKEHVSELAKLVAKPKRKKRVVVSERHNEP